MFGSQSNSTNMSVQWNKEELADEEDSEDNDNVASIMINTNAANTASTHL